MKPFHFVIMIIPLACATTAWPRENNPEHDDAKLKSAVKKELDTLQGAWTLVSREIDGKKVAGEDEETILTFRGDIVVGKERDVVSQVAIIKIVAPTENPKKMDMVITDGTQEGETSLAVYKVEGEYLTFCSSYAHRPKRFGTKEGDESFCATYKRAKAKR